MADDKERPSRRYPLVQALKQSGGPVTWQELLRFNYTGTVPKPLPPEDEVELREQWERYKRDMRSQKSATSGPAGAKKRQKQSR